jgi:LPXTG-motif cell wall-anchored protein
MSRQTTHSRPIGFRWLRSLLAFRHRNPAARFVSAVVAFAMATLLAVGTGAAYGDGTTPAPDATTTDTSTAGADTSTPTDPPPSDPAPVTDPAPTDANAPALATGDATTPDSTTSNPKPAAKTNTVLNSASGPLLVPLALPCTVFGGFEIDGNTLDDPLCAGDDWSSLGMRHVDHFSAGVDPTDPIADTTGFTQGSSEVTFPKTWAASSGTVTPSKDDIGSAWAYSRLYEGHVWSYFAFNRPVSKGDTAYDVEFNQLGTEENNAGNIDVPKRKVGDLLLQFDQDGNNLIRLDRVLVWTLTSDDTWSTSLITMPDGSKEKKCFEVGGYAPDNAGWCIDDSVDTSAFHPAVASDGLFAEGAVDFNDLFPAGTCTGDFGKVSLRSRASTSATSALQDYVDPFDLRVRSTCGSLTIEKKGLTGDTLVPGAAYSIVDDPRPGKTGTYNVFDGTTAQLAALTGTPTLPANTVADGTADGRIVVANAEPGSYTVTELRAPAGYLLPAPADRTQTDVVVGNAGDTNADVTVTFRDPKKWAPLTASKTAAGHYDIGWDITKQVSAEADPAESDWKTVDTAYSSSTTHDFMYRVRVTQQAASNYRVTGAVTVHNPNLSAVTATLTEVPGLSDTGGSCSFDPGQVGANGAITVAPDDNPATPAVEDSGTSYTYTCTFASPPADGTSATGTNTAHLEWSSSAYPQNQGDVDGSSDATRTDRFQQNPVSDTYSFTAAADQPTSVTVKDYATVPDQADPVHHVFTTTETGGVGTIDGNGDWVLTWTPGGGPYDATYTRAITGTAGQCTAEHANPNTASLYVTGEASSFDDSTAEAVLCVGADIDVLDKNATGTLYRTYPWSIRKSTSTPKLNSDVSTTGQYDVTVTTGPGKDAEWGMTGTIQVRNPNTWGGGVPVTVQDTYYTDSTTTTQVPGSSCVVNEVQTGVDGDGKPVFESFSGAYTIPELTTATFRYTCTFDSGGDASYQPTYTGTNKATATWDKDVALTPNDSDFFAYQVKNDDAQLAKSLTNDWIKNLVNDTITVADDNATPLDPTDDRHWDLSWSEVYNNNAQHAITLDATSDPSTDIVFGAPADGTCVTHRNTVTITSDGRSVLESDGTAENHESTDDNHADVQICNPDTLTGSKTATPQFTRTYHWQVIKQVRTKAQYGEPAGAWQDVTASWTGDHYSHDFEYRVIVKQTPTDSAYKMTGTITVHNPNTDSNIGPISAIVSEPTTIGGVTASCSIDDGNLATPPNAAVVTLASNTAEAPNATDVTLPYTCELAGRPADGTRNSVTVAWGAGPSESTTLQSPTPGVTYDSPTTEVDTSVTAVDDMGTTTAGDDVTLGSVTWDQAGGDGYTFPVYSATHTATSTGCSTDNEWTNTVTISSGPTVKDTDTATAAICPNAGTWTVSKSVEEPNAVAPGTTLHYTLTASKTGGVDPENIDVVDALGPMTQYLTGDPVVTTAGADTSYADGTLTWHIAKLSGTQTLDFEVTVKADAYGVDLPNLVTSLGSSNCPDAEHVVAACQTDNKTPHYTLAKSSDEADQTVMPPDLGADGTLITYTLTVHNDSQVPINSTTMGTDARTVTDDLTDVLDNATLDETSITGSGGSTATYDPATKKISWILPTIAVGGDATLTYQVTVNAGQWNQTLTNVAAPGEGGDCVPVLAVVAPLVNPNCTTTSTTPGYGKLQALKLDADTQAPLPGATFALYLGTDTTATPLASATSGVDGIALFDVKLRPGDFTIVETAAPTGYSLPAGGAAEQPVKLTEQDMNEGDPATQVTFRDPPTGALSIAKAHQELVGGTWVPSDGTIAFNDQVKYVMTVTATGTKVFHDVTVTDYVPGYNPADTQTQLGGFKGVIDPSSIRCGAVFTTCTANYDAATGLVTWALGDVGDETGTVEFVVRMPDLPRVSPIAAPGVAFAGLMWNQAYLAWTQVDDAAGAPPHSQDSNAVTDSANEVLPPKQEVTLPKQHHSSVLPNTGGPDRWVLAAGLALLLAGATLVVGDRRRRRRS